MLLLIISLSRIEALQGQMSFCSESDSSKNSMNNTHGMKKKKETSSNLGVHNVVT